MALRSPASPALGLAGESSADARGLEFMVLQGAVVLAPYIAFRHPELFITASDCLFLVALVLRLRSGIPVRPFGTLTELWLLGFVMLAGGLFLGAVVNGDPLRSLVVNAQYAFAYIAVPYAILGRPADQMLQLIRCWVVSMSLMCAIGIGFYVSGYTGGSTRHLAIVTGGRRLSGFVDNANGMAGYIVLTLPLLWMLWQARAIRRAVALAYLALLAVALVFTSSNTGLVGLAAVILILFVGGRNPGGLIAAVALAYVVLTWGAPYLPAVFQERVLTAIAAEDISQSGTYVGRQKLVVEAWEMADKHLLVGLGADQYREVSRYGLPVHNTYLLLLNEGGVAALLGFLIMGGAAMLTPLVMRPNPYGGMTVLATAATTIVLAGMAVGYTHIYARSLVLPVILALSPAVALVRRPRPQVRNTR